MELGPPPREEIVASVLHVLATHTETSPLSCRIDGDEDVPFAPSISACDSEGDCHHLRSWLDTVLLQMSDETDGGVGGGVDEGMLQKAMDAFADSNQMDGLLQCDGRPSDAVFWHAGLELLRTNLFPRDTPIGGDTPEPTLSPHELLLVVSDSYYSRDEDIELGELSAMDEGGASTTGRGHTQLPSSIAMFVLRTLLISHALESAEESIAESLKSSQPVRWKRLKSMVDDALSLFQKITANYLAASVEKCPINPKHCICTATWLYTNQLFPVCHNLLSRILENQSNKNATWTSRRNLLRTCYRSFGYLTSLAALDATLVKQEYDSPSRCLHWILSCIESETTNTFFDDVKLSQKKLIDQMNTHDVTQNNGEDATVYCPWEEKDPNFNGRGLTVEEDLLLYPSIFMKFNIMANNNEVDKDSTSTVHDKLGIAMIAYWKVRAEAEISPALDPLPYPYSGSYRWTLLFPHVLTLLGGTPASSTVSNGELESDGAPLGVNFAIISLGFDMLQTITTKLPAVRPSSSCSKSHNAIIRWTHSAQGLEQTIASLFSHVVRLAYLEASMANGPNSDAGVALKYSSIEVKNMAGTLLGFYDPLTQIMGLSTVCQLIKTTDAKVLLPTALDFMRIIIMDMCDGIKNYDDENNAWGGMTLMQRIIAILDNFLSDMSKAFDRSTAPLPKDVDVFMQFSETHSSVLAIVRLQRIWISRCQKVSGKKWQPGDEAKLRFDGIVEWMDSCLGKLSAFESSLSRFIDFCQTAEDPPPNWHRLFLTKFAIEDALANPGD